MKQGRNMKEEVYMDVDAIVEKIQAVLMKKYSIFHSDLITRAIFSDEVTVEDFEQALSVIDENLKEDIEDIDEFVPEQLINI